MMLLLLKTIPVVAVKYFECNYITTESNNTGHPDLLGLYKQRVNGAMPHIELLTDNIKSKGNDYDRDCTIVLLHELAHAVMDVENYDITDKYSNLYRSYSRISFAGESEYYTLALDSKTSHIDFFHIREESYANLITIKVIAQADKTQRLNGWMKYLKDFISNQPPSYAFANKITGDNNILGWVKSKFSNPIDQQQAEEWMDAAEKLFGSNMTYGDYKKIETKLNMPWAQ